MKLKSSIPMIAVAAALAASPATAATAQYTPFQTDFPSTSQTHQRFVPGVTDFPRTSPIVVPQSTLTADDGIEWGDTSIIASIVAAVGLAGSALLIRRRSTLAHS